MMAKDKGEVEEVLLRYKYFRISPDALCLWLKDKMVLDIILNPLPKDTRIIRTGMDSMGNWTVVIESSEFPLINVLKDSVPFYGDIQFRKPSKQVQ